MRPHNRANKAEKQRAPAGRSGEKGKAKRKNRGYHDREYEDHGKQKKAQEERMDNTPPSEDSQRGGYEEESTEKTGCEHLVR